MPEQRLDITSIAMIVLNKPQQLEDLIEEAVAKNDFDYIQKVCQLAGAMKIWPYIFKSSSVFKYIIIHYIYHKPGMLARQIPWNQIKHISGLDSKRHGIKFTIQDTLPDAFWGLLKNTPPQVIYLSSFQFKEGPHTDDYHLAICIILYGRGIKPGTIPTLERRNKKLTTLLKSLGLFTTPDTSFWEGFSPLDNEGSINQQIIRLQAACAAPPRLPFVQSIALCQFPYFISELLDQYFYPGGEERLADLIDTIYKSTGTKDLISTKEQMNIWYTQARIPHEHESLRKVRDCGISALGSPFLFLFLEATGLDSTLFAAFSFTIHSTGNPRTCLDIFNQTFLRYISREGGTVTSEALSTAPSGVLSIYEQAKNLSKAMSPSQSHLR